MHESQDRVEFFHSESSFGTESNMSQSRYYDFTNELIAQTDNVFLTLKRQLQPNQSLSQQEKIDYAMRRAQILSKDTIPQHIVYLNKIDAPQNAKQQVMLCSEKLAKLLDDHQKLKNGTMIYKQFYNVYGKEFGLQSGTFSRKKEVLQVEVEQEEYIKPQYIQINYSQGRQKLSAATPRVFVAPPQNINDKELTNLRQEVYKLKKTIEQNKKKYEQQLTNQQLTFEKRMRIYLSSQSTAGQIQKNLNDELKQNSQKLTKALLQNEKLNQIISEKDKSLETIKNQNSQFKEQIQLLRKTDCNMLQYQEVMNKSYNSQAMDGDDKKNQKILKNLIQENDLLKNQLKAQRQRFYRMQSDLTDEQRRELDRNRKNLQKKRNQLEQLYSDFDKQRIQILQLGHSCKTNEKLVQSLKRQNGDLKAKLGKINMLEQVRPTVLQFSINQEKSVEISRISKLQILQYEGDGIEGFPYYDTLSKEFKIRFKRACLKEKQLLYKSNGVQIGVISNFEKPNKINILAHITNYSDHKFQKVKIRIMNANQNKIQGEAFDYPCVSENQQVKIPICISIHQYPIGPLILLLEYVSQKKEEIRILLPAHIFKTVIAQERSDNINPANANKLTVATERKICKDVSDLKQHLKVDKITNGVLKASLFNEHTHTLFYLDMQQAQNGIELVYQHKQGNRFITQYFIKTFAFLIGKDMIR